SESNKNQFNFMHDNVTDTWSVNLWIKQNSGEFLPPQAISPNQNFILRTTSTNEDSGIAIYLQGNKTGVFITNLSVTSILDGNLGTQTIPADTNWHMLTYIVEKSNATSTALVCIDNVCDQIDRDTPHLFTSSAIAEGAMFLTDENENTAGSFGLAHTAFNLDELCIWKDYKLTSANRATLFNSGSGERCGTVSASGGGGGGGGGTSSFTTQMKSVVLSLGDFGNNAKNFEVNGTALPTTFGTPIIVSDPIVISTSTSNVKIFFDEFVLQSQPPSPTPPPISPITPPPTKGPGGGGVPSLSVQDQQQFFEDLFGFSLFSKIHQMQIGQIQDGTIDITWNSPSQITIEGIEVGDQFVTWIGFPRTPFSLDGSDRISTGKIPYRIMPPNQLCDEVTGSSANCVDRILYEIPIKIHASVDGQPLTANTVVKVNLSLDITLALFTIFIAFAAGLGAIIYRSAIAHKQQKREKKKLTTKSKGRERMESRFGVKKAKIRRR
ncbi:MAG: hypothetical protein O6761_06410, partial [Thaumarchaeota archaeon]|nr:hypothetical protein [Nitrososphaerota archaeon]